ncbi:hypothetical protein [Roseibium sp.]|uniref:hypothetical protein n=1 Tax=Roseibium sp. TaxID=1936156 RepID=UPI001B1A9F16|nr:hypothetical protein [Roseibium sp.]MBO6858339.1 hypothetical protein [Roseibium sp.]
MYEFTFEIECAGHPVGDMEIAVDATLTGSDDFDLNGLYLFIAKTGDAIGQPHKRYVRATDRVVVKQRRFGMVTEHWRSIPETDVFFPEILEAVELERDAILKHLHQERAAA